jgi:hypothetical protein
MKLISKYTFTNNRQIWRIIPGGERYLIIEERNPITREVFFSCIEMKTGKVILDSLQFDEKYWMGIEDVYKDVIYFHKYNKPDMPWHSDIMAYDINKKEILWHSEEFIFSLVYENNLYCYKNNYDGRIFYKLNYKTGDLISDIVDYPNVIAGLKELRDAEIYNGYKFPEELNLSINKTSEIFNAMISGESITGKIDFMEVNGLMLTSYHRVLYGGKLQNCFKALDIRHKKVIFKEILNKEITNFIPDSFFLINDLIFLLKEKEKLFVFLVTE